MDEECIEEETFFTASDKIRDMELESLGLSQRKKELAEQMQSMKSEYVEVVEERYERTNNPDLSNEVKRNNAVEKMLSQDNEYQKIRSTYKEIDLELKTLNIDIGFEKREFTRKMRMNSSLLEIANSLEKVTEGMEKLVEIIDKKLN